MQIALPVHKFPPESLGGTEIYTLTLARALAQAGHTAAVFYPTAQVATLTSKEIAPNLTCWQAPLPATRASEGPIQQFWHTFRDHNTETHFQRFLQEAQPDLIHFQHVQGVSARLMALAAGLPRVLTLHDYWYFCANSQLIRPDRQPCGGPNIGCRNCVDCATARADLQSLQWLRPLVGLPFVYRNHYLRQMSALIDCFIAPSEFLRQQYIQQGWPANKVRTIENGMDRRRLLAADASALPVPPQRPHFGFIGSLAWQKGVHVLIEAFNQLPEHAALTIYGNETVFPDYTATLRQLARHPQIRFAGPIGFDQVGAALQQLDALVVPSLWYENSPLVIQEAYIVGVPVIASRIGALAEKVQDQQNGLLFPTGNSQALAATLQQLIDHPEQLTTLRRGITPPPTLEEHLAQLVALYQSLLRQRRVESSPPTGFPG
ncbi:MAG: glycosyltransferase family 4 protein [Caldilineaceae bacterium]|nr:glycosyltransferase family 4 protein [Caldilineaceae bacterium]